MRGDGRPALAAVLAAALLAGAAGSAQEGAAQEEILGAPAAPAPGRLDEERVPVEAGAVVRADPDRGAPVLATVDAATELPLLERRDAWLRVRYGALKGWVLAAGVAPPEWHPADEPWTVAPSSTTPGAAGRAESERIERARRLLGEAAREAPLGDFRLLTDLGAAESPERLPAIAAGLRRTYEERYGLATRPGPVGTVVLFRTEADYRSYEAADPSVAGLSLDGHASGSVAALFLGDRTGEELLPLVIHELTHLLNRRAFLAIPPPWIEEGVANDLAYSRADRQGRLLPGTVGGEAAEGRRVVRFSGPFAALSRLAKASNQARLTPLAELTDATWPEFQRPEGRPLRYAESAFFLRYLLDADRGRRAESTRGWLAALAAGETGPPADLAGILGTRWPELDAAFASWLRTVQPWSFS